MLSIDKRFKSDCFHQFLVSFVKIRVCKQTTPPYREHCLSKINNTIYSTWRIWPSPFKITKRYLYKSGFTALTFNTPWNTTKFYDWIPLLSYPSLLCSPPPPLYLSLHSFLRSLIHFPHCFLYLSLHLLHLGSYPLSQPLLFQFLTHLTFQHPLQSQPFFSIICIIF